jgi:hypothetical protein
MIGWLGYVSALAGHPDRDRNRRYFRRSGRTARALSPLVQTCDAHEGALGYTSSDPSWDVIAGDERFKTILRTMRVENVRRPTTP